MVVSYEAFTANPDLMLPAILQFIEEKYKPEYLDFKFSNSSHDSAPRKISDESVGKWRRNLQSREIWWVEKITGTQMESFGYALNSPRIQIFGVLLDFLVLPLKLGQALWVNRKNRGPLIPYVLRRLKGLIK